MLLKSRNDVCHELVFEEEQLELIGEFQNAIELLFRHQFSESPTSFGIHYRMLVPGSRDIPQVIRVKVTDKDLVWRISDRLLEALQMVEHQGKY